MAPLIRAHSGSETAPSALVGSPHSTTRVTPSGYSAVGVVTTATEDRRLVQAAGPGDGDEGARVVEVVLDEAAVRAGQHLLELVGVDQAPPPGAQHLAGVVVERLEPLGRRQLDRRDGAASDARVEPYDDLVRLAVRAGHPSVRLHLLDAGAVREPG